MELIQEVVKSVELDQNKQQLKIVKVEIEDTSPEAYEDEEIDQFGNLNIFDQSDEGRRQVVFVLAVW